MKANAQHKRRPFDREVQAGGPAIRPEYLRKATEAEPESWRQRMELERNAQQRRERIILVVAAGVFLGWAFFVLVPSPAGFRSANP